jgi:hypothetical protein
MGWWNDLRRTRSTAWCFTGIAPDRVPDKLELTRIEPETSYVSAYLRSMHIADVRVGVKRFYGAVTSSCSLATRSGNVAEFMVVTTPSVLKDTDAKNLDRVITGTRRLLGPIPYRGGDLDTEIGLFSIPTADLLEPYLEVLEKITTVAGINLVASVGQLVAPVKQGLNLLLGSSDSTVLEIGLAQTWPKPETGYFCVVRVPNEQVEDPNFGLSEDFRLLSADGSPVREPYIVFSIHAEKQRDDWATIPEILEAYEEVRAMAKRGDQVGATEALTVFKRVAIFSPELLAEDGVRLFNVVKKETALAFPATGTAAVGKRTMAELSSLPLYA